jgi:hypothetical protein
MQRGRATALLDRRCCFCLNRDFHVSTGFQTNHFAFFVLQNVIDPDFSIQISAPSTLIRAFSGSAGSTGRISFSTFSGKVTPALPDEDSSLAICASWFSVLAFL